MPAFQRLLRYVLRYRRAFLLGLTTGLIYFTGTLYWITHVMAVYGGLQTWVAIAINAALIAYLALFPALFALLTRRIVMGYGRLALMSAPVVWVATELGRTYLFSGFPWVLLGYSQAAVLPIAQLASLLGVYGVSMLVAAVSTGHADVLTDENSIPVKTNRPFPVMRNGEQVAQWSPRCRGFMAVPFCVILPST